MSNPNREATYTPSNFPGGEIVIINDSTFNNVAGNLQIYHGQREALQLLIKNVSSAAFHNSKERFDPPKCHQNTRAAVLNKIMDWIISRDPDTRDKLIMWLRGAAGAGKSAIAQTLAELCEEQNLILASYFFGRLDSTRNHPRALIATIAYQMYTNIPGTQAHILDAIDNDHLIFERNLVTQLATLIHQPLQKLTQASTAPLFRRLIIIDGLDECNGDDAQREVIDAIFHAVNQLRVPIFFLVASRPELNITVSFDMNTLNTLGRIPLDDDYRNDKDIELFLRDKFRQIKETHRLKRFLPATWPNEETISILVSKSSGQFIYAATAIKYVESARERPDVRLEIIQGLRPRQNDKDMPFAELDKLYAHILSGLGPLENITLVLDILQFVINIPSLTDWDICDLEYIFELNPGGIETLLSDLGGLVDVVEGRKYPFDFVVTKKGPIIKILHASFQDFLSDPVRSKDYYRSPTQAILKQLKRCFKFIKKSCSAPSNTISDSALLAAGSIFVNMDKNVQCDIELANILDDCSVPLGQLMQSPAFSNSIRRYYCVLFIPQIFHFLKRSNMIEVYLKFKMTLDDEYHLTVIEPYYRDAELSFLLASLCLTERIPRRGDSTKWAFSAGSIDRDDLFVGRRITPAFHIINHHDIIHQYLRSPGQSRHHSLKTSGGRLYSNALLHVLRCLHLVEPDPDFLYRTLPFGEYSQKHLRPYDQRDSQILLQWTQIGSRNNHEDSQEGATDTALNLYNYLESLQTLYEDDPSIPDDPSLHDLHDLHDFWGMISRGGFNWLNMTSNITKYLATALYFFPRAGRCEKLLHLCETRYVPKNVLSREHEKMVFRAMDAYMDRWKEGGSASLEVDEWAYPFPLVKRRVSIFTEAEKLEILKVRSQSSV